MMILMGTFGSADKPGMQKKGTVSFAEAYIHLGEEQVVFSA